MSTFSGPGVAQLFGAGVQHHQAGRLAEAEAHYRQVLALEPNHADSLHNLGVLAHQAGRSDLAAELIGKAATLNGAHAGVHSNLGMALNALGRFEEAAAACRRAVALKADYAPAHRNLGAALEKLDRRDEAEASYRRALALGPQDLGLHSSLGNLLAARGAFGEAEALFRRALELSPAHAEAHANLGMLFWEQGRFEEAVAAYRRAIALNPADAETHNNLSVALWRMHRLDEALSAGERAVALKPGLAEAHNSLGNALKGLGRTVEAEQAYRRAAALKPGYAEPHGNLALIAWERGRLDDCAAACRAALDADPAHVSALTTLAITMAVQGRFEEAESCYQRVLALRPDDQRAHSSRLFALNYEPDKSAEEIFEAYRAYDALFPVKPAPRPREAAGRRLRLGYVSPDFRRHPVRHFLEPVFERHDRERFEVHAYAEVVAEDEVTERFRRWSDGFVETNALDDRTLAERIRADGIDILIDLAGPTASNRLGAFALRPAPVSVSWIGAGYTTGLKAIDYILADRVMAPEGSEGLFGETPWPLRSTYVFRPAEGMGDPGPLPALARGGIAFATLTRAIRVNHRTIRAWSAVLKRVPGSRLVVDSRDFQQPFMRAGLLERFAAEGIGPERLEVGFHSPPWDLLRQVDITFDCFPHNSGTTLFESIYMGVPVVSLAGRPSLGRIGASILTAIGRREWIASSEEDYVETAVRLASDLPALAGIRERLRSEMQASPLMDETGFVRGLEEAYLAMWEARVRSG